MMNLCLQPSCLLKYQRNVVDVARFIWSRRDKSSVVLEHDLNASATRKPTWKDRLLTLNSAGDKAELADFRQPRNALGMPILDMDVCQRFIASS